MSISAISDSSIYSLFQSSGLLGESSSTGQFSSALSDTGGSDASGTTTDLGALLQALSANSLLAQMFLGSTAGGSDGTGTSVSSISPTDSTSSTDTSTSSLEDDLASLIEALQSGDTESAQSIFAGILDKMQSVSGASSSDSSVSSVSSTSTMDLSSLLNNVGGSGGSSGGSDAASASSAAAISPGAGSATRTSRTVKGFSIGRKRIVAVAASARARKNRTSVLNPFVGSIPS